ncbi:MAG: TolB family protein [Kofleriaceae bacterium]
MTIVCAGVFLGCGSVSDKPRDSGPDDASPDDEAPGDIASEDAPSLGPWGALEPMMGLADADVRGGTLTSDLREVYFTSSIRPGGIGGFEIWTSRRADVTAVWGTPSLVTTVNSTSSDADPFVSDDGLSLWLVSDRNGNFDMFVSVRASRQDPWGTPQVINNLNTVMVENSPSVIGSGLLMVLGSDRSGNYDLFTSSRASVGQPWGTPVPIAEVNSAGEDFGTVSATGLQLYVTSNRLGSMGRDIYQSTRSSLNAPFSTPVAVPELSSPGSDEVAWVSADERYIMITRRGGGDTYHRALEARR